MFRPSKVVCVDCGRSSVKFTDSFDKPRDFKSLYHPVRLDQLLSMPALTDKLPMVIQWKDETYAVGDFAVYFQDSVSSMVDEDFVNQSVLYYLVAIAFCVSSGDDVTLGLNLTFNTMRFKEHLRSLLMGKHEIGIYDFKRSEWIKKTFTISKVGVVYQGWSALVAICLDKNKKFKPEFSSYLTQEGLIFDVGRRTVDVLQIRNMTPVDGATYDYGTYSVYSEVSSALRQKYSINKPVYDIEDRHIRGVGIRLQDNRVVNVPTLVDKHAEVVTGRVVAALKEYLYQQTPDFVYMVGGGAYMFSKYFKGTFANLQTVEDAQYLNAMGMYTFFHEG